MSQTIVPSVLHEPADQDYGDRLYDAVDPEGDRWYLAQRIRHVALEDWGATVTG